MTDNKNITEYSDIPCPRLKNEEPKWVKSLNIFKGDIIVEMKDSLELFETIMYIIKYTQRKYIVVFNDFDKLVQFLIAYVNVMEISDLYVYGFNYLRFAFPYIKYTSTLQVNRDNSIVLTMKNKIENLDRQYTLFTHAIYTYDENDEDRISGSNIILTTSKFIPNTIKTFDETFTIRPHKINIAFIKVNYVSTIINYMIKYDHRKIVLFYADDNVVFPTTLTEYVQIDYSSDYDEDHLRNNNDCRIVMKNINTYHNTLYNKDKVYIFNKGEDLINLTNDKQLLVFNGYKKSNHLLNLLSNISDKLKTVDIIFLADNMNKLLEEDLQHYVEMFPNKKIHYLFDAELSLVDNEKNSRISQIGQRFLYS